jgi:hypothetical protein
MLLDPAALAITVHPYVLGDCKHPPQHRRTAAVSMPGFMYAQPGVLQQIFRFGPRGLLSEKESQQIGA